jgi:hypothetical protein
VGRRPGVRDRGQRFDILKRRASTSCKWVKNRERMLRGVSRPTRFLLANRHRLTSDAAESLRPLAAITSASQSAETGSSIVNFERRSPLQSPVTSARVNVISPAVFAAVARKWPDSHAKSFTLKTSIWNTPCTDGARRQQTGTCRRAKRPQSR